MQRVVEIKLHPTSDQYTALFETAQQYADCFNVVADEAWRTGTTNGVELHHATYYPLRETHSDLPSQLVISARNKAREAVKSAFERRKRGQKASCPRSRLGAIRYDARTYTYWPERGEVSLSTVAGRQKMRLTVPDYFQGMLEEAEDFDSADLVYYSEQDSFWLHLVVTLPDVAVEPKGPVVGVDMGLTRLAVSSTNAFYSGKQIKETNNRYFRLRRALQTKGTKSAKRHLRKLSRRQKRFQADVNHVVSKRLVESLPLVA